MQKFSCVHITNSMSECAEISLFIHKSQRTNSLCIVPHPDSQLVLSPDIFYRSNRKRDFFPVSDDLKCHLWIIQLRKILDQLFFTVHRLVIKCHNIITRLHNIFCRILCKSLLRNNFSGINHQYTVCLHIDSDRVTGYHDRFTVRRGNLHIFKWKYTEDPGFQKIASVTRYSNCIIKT